jgi:DNA-binding MarR family transcriptional regulator
MPLLMLRDLPRYDCLLKAAELYPSLNPTACDAFLNLLRTGDLVSAEAARFWHHWNLSQGRFTVLMLLNRACDNPLTTPAELAEAACVTRATMTGLIDTLVKDGFVVREDDPGDRRTVHVRLTLQGQQFIESMLPQYFTLIAQIMSPLNEDERKQLVQLLQKIQGGRPSQSNNQTNA